MRLWSFIGRSRTSPVGRASAFHRYLPGIRSALDPKRVLRDTVSVALSTSSTSTTQAEAEAQTTPPSRPIYVSATHQHVGKTTTCLALISGLQKRIHPKTVGYLKPVGQEHVEVRSDELGETIRVDKDVALIREKFNLRHIDYRHMSPVLIPRGYTKDYIDGKISNDAQLEAIRDAVRSISACSGVVLCEGTGHCGVGSIVGASNARVASITGAAMVLIANGGLGSCFDELELNRVLCEHHGVSIAGVIINKVLPEKYEQTKDYMSRALENSWNVPLLGCVPDYPYLGCPALADLERLLNTELISGHRHRFRHYPTADTHLVTTSLPTFLLSMREKPDQTLYVCHVTRDDIILGFFAEFHRRKMMDEPFEAALVVCGQRGKYSLDKVLLDMVMAQDKDVPVMVCPYTTDQAMDMIHLMTPKLNISDEERVNAATEHYEKHIDYDLLLSRTGNDIG